MKRYHGVLIALLFPILLFVNAWQAFRFEMLSREVVGLEQQQHDVIEKNKRSIATLSVLRSPARIRDIASGQLGLDRVDSNRVFTIQLESRR
ncbi:MAG: cell division protein FtsL [Spirochaetaceae bacterium]|nr:MAG: cell division protein FtsL [Spirochaetaceae bacterium]